ncbi:conserved hypothetical protein [Histoplasma capsulatum var. duboisii H88]|uniref:Uncharacterized protein n=2 Tax=Ajellomyces capsulatus TaxID=5037 RepID=F0UGN9_AJEC8|nr:conserved hypothetical protein [Histoplasma capsulatum H143]EGC44339.1 conserved hypothetical protein [Histoplasma capsulatum var. duboisii H88]QSS55117.1 hypothetical protein I7I53_02904 [Histoplasma capsulatum var. duboisii H88]
MDPATLHGPPEGPKMTQQSSSSHLDPTLSVFADPAFDPVEYLNNILPPFSFSLSSSQTTTAITPTAKPKAADTSTTTTTSTVSLAALSAQTQSLVSQLSAQNVRLSNILTQLTDEILRGGGRLAYEVEVLRGEVVGLSDALGEGLVDDIGRFVPGGKILDIHAPAETDTGAEAGTETQEKPGDLADNATKSQSQSQTRTEDDQKQPQTHEPQQPQPQPAVDEPVYLTQLRTLTNVRARLEQVIHTFGEAMEWPLAPSEISVASSFISVSAPEPGAGDQHSREEKGKEVARKLREEIMELLNKDNATGTTTDQDIDTDGVEAASRRVAALRELAGVWKGTAEEKARMKFVDGLAKMVEERRKVVQSEREREMKGRLTGNSNAGWDGKVGGAQEGRSSTNGAGNTTAARSSAAGSGGGLLRNLQRLRDEIYLD